MLDNPIIRKPLYCHLWNILLLLAQHEPTEYIWNGQRKTLESGQLMTGRKKLSELSGISESQIEKILKYFKNEQQITQEKTNRYRIISIVNWEKYQSLQPDDTTGEQQKDNRGHNQRTTERQQKDTYKNVNNEKNDKKSYTQQQCFDEGIVLGIPEQHSKVFYEHYAAQGWVWGGGQPIADLRKGMMRCRNNGTLAGLVKKAEGKNDRTDKHKGKCDSDRRNSYAEQESEIGQTIE